MGRHVAEPGTSTGSRSAAPAAGTGSGAGTSAHAAASTTPGRPEHAAPAGPAHRNDPEVMRRLLATPGRWAVVGLSQNQERVAYDIGHYLQHVLGMEIVPVHPSAQTVHGAQGYATLDAVPGPIDVVDVFVRSSRAGEVVDQAIALGAKAVWLQLGVIDEAAAARAKEAGLEVVMDTCPAIEAPRLGIEKL